MAFCNFPTGKTREFLHVCKLLRANSHPGTIRVKRVWYSYDYVRDWLAISQRICIIHSFNALSNSPMVLVS